MGRDAVAVHDIFQRHLRHTSCAAADDGFALQILPAEILIGAAHQERAVPFGELGKQHGIVLLALVIHIDAGFGPGQTDVRLTGHHGGHDLVGAAAVAQHHIQSLIGKEALADGHILRRIEHRMCDLRQAHGDQVLLLSAAAQQQRQDQTRQQQTDE